MSAPEPAAAAALDALTQPPNHPSLTASSEPALETTPAGYTAHATYDFPDGGRFELRLSGPPFTAFIDGRDGLPDGFLMEINNYIFSTLLSSTIPTPHAAVTSLLDHAVALYERAARPRPPVEHHHPSTVRASRLATAALSKQLSLLERSDTRRDGYTVKPKDDNLYIWTVFLFFEENIQQHLTAAGHVGLELELRFPSDFPYSPPFARVVAPCVKCRFVMPRGGICMQLFSTSGWSPANSIDAVCVQIRAMLISGGIEVDAHRCGRYTYEGALRDSQNAVRQHRWDDPTPPAQKRKKVAPA